MSSTGFQPEERDCHDLRVAQPDSQEGLRKSSQPLAFTLDIAKNHCPATLIDIASQSICIMFN